MLGQERFEHGPEVWILSQIFSQGVVSFAELVIRQPEHRTVRPKWGYSSPSSTTICPVLSMCMSSTPARVFWAASNALNPNMGGDTLHGSISYSYRLCVVYMRMVAVVEHSRDAILSLSCSGALATRDSRSVVYGVYSDHPTRESNSGPSSYEPG